MTLMPSGKIDFLVSMVVTSSQARQARDGLREYLSIYEDEAIDRECMMGLGQWLATSLALCTTERVGETLEGCGPFVLAVLYLEELVGTWTSSEPSREKRLCIGTTIEILSGVVSRPERRFLDAEDEVLASYLLSSAAWRDQKVPVAECIQRAIEGNVLEDVLRRSSFYKAVGSTPEGDVEAMVQLARKLFLG